MSTAPLNTSTALSPTAPLVGRASVAQRREALSHLKAIREQHGCVPEVVMATVADQLQVAPSHLRRLFVEFRRTDKVRERPGSSKKMELPNPHRAQVMYFMYKGNARAAWEALLASGDIPASMSEKTFSRRVNEWDQALLACAKGGYRAMIEHQFFNKEHIPYKGYAYGTDHTKLSIMVIPERGMKPIWPWLTTVADLGARPMLAYKLTAHVPTSEDSIDTLLEAIDGWYTEDGMFVGGKPKFLRSDRGGDYISKALTKHLMNLEVGRQFTEPYSSWQNGRIEAINGTIDQRFAPTMPGFHPGGEEEYTRRVLKTPIDPKSLVTLETLDRRLGEFFGDYNSTPHRSLNGMTPLEAWADDANQPPRADRETIIAAMTPRETRRLHKYGIEMRGAIYSHPTLATLRKANVTSVEVRFHDHDRSRIEVMVDGVHECTAIKSSLQPEHHRLGVLSTRKAQRRAAEKLIRCADYERVLAERARLREEGIDESEMPVLPPDPTADESDDALDPALTDALAAKLSGGMPDASHWAETAGGVLSVGSVDSMLQQLSDNPITNPDDGETQPTIPDHSPTTEEGAA